MGEIRDLDSGQESLSSDSTLGVLVSGSENPCDEGTSAWGFYVGWVWV